MGKTKARAKTKVQVSLGMFSLRYEGGERAAALRVERAGVPIERFAPLGLDDYRPGGGTPLRDATMEMIRHLDDVRKRRPGDVVIGLLADESGSMEHNRAAVVQGLNDFVAGMADVDEVDAEAGGKVLCVVVTDGHENSSAHVTPGELHEATAQREADGWTFIYLGANQDAWDEGTRQVGVSGRATGQTVSFASTPMGTTSALSSVSADTRSYLSDNKAYHRERSASSNRVVSESGDETVVTPEEPAPSEPYGDVEAALKRARGEK